jgi:signal recognition particle subunit SRP54
MFKGMPKMTPEITSKMEQEFNRTEAIINSMTPREREDHHIINGSRRKRIAIGSGTAVSEVNNLLKQYAEMRKMMKQMADGGMFGGIGGRVARRLTGIGPKRKKKKKKRK